MTLAEAKGVFAKKIADTINESKLPPTIVRMVLADIDKAVAVLEEQQYQKSMASEEGDIDG